MRLFVFQDVPVLPVSSGLLSVRNALCNSLLPIEISQTLPSSEITSAKYVANQVKQTNSEKEHEISGDHPVPEREYAIALFPQALQL